MNEIYIIERLSSNEDFEDYNHSISFVTDDIQFAKNKIKSLIKEEIDAFNINNDAVGCPYTAKILNDVSYVINREYSQELIEYEITKWKVL